jgi:hypothetical protein
MRTWTSCCPPRHAQGPAPHPCSRRQGSRRQPRLDRGGFDGRLGHSEELSAHVDADGGRLSLTASGSGLRRRRRRSTTLGSTRRRWRLRQQRRMRQGCRLSMWPECRRRRTQGWPQSRRHRWRPASDPSCSKIDFLLACLHC